MSRFPAVFAISFCMIVLPVQAADLVITPADQDHILLDVLSDTQCPLVCPESWIPRCPNPPCPDSINCCDSFQEVVSRINAQGNTADFRYLNGDLGIDSHATHYPWTAAKFFGLWNQLPEPKSYGMGNHEADIGLDGNGQPFWTDPANHYAPTNWWEPLFGCDSTTAVADCRRWYSVYIGSPPRVALLVTNSNSDSDLDEDAYIYCAIPWDGLHTAGTVQRQWLNNEIDNLPASVEVVFVAGHRTYYGVENYYIRPNVVYSAAGENQRTSPTSFLRDVESVYDRCPNVRRVIMLNGDQHCFAETYGIRQNVRDDDRGVVYLTLGISGARNNRATPFPKLSKIPSGLLAFAFDDRWGFTRLEIDTDRVRMTLREAYTDSLIHESEWLFAGPAVAVPAVDVSAPGESIRAWPNPSTDGVRIEFRPPLDFPEKDIDDFAIYDVGGRCIRTLYSGAWSDGAYRRWWDSTDESGHRVAAGTYLARVKYGDRIAVKTLTVLR